MKILSIIIIGLLLSNCTNSYVKNKKTINHLMIYRNLLIFFVIKTKVQKNLLRFVEMAGLKI